MDLVLHPVTQYIVTSAGLGLCLYLFYTLKLELQARELRYDKKVLALADAVAALRTSLYGARSEMRDLQEHSGMLVPPSPTASGLNLSKRAQVLQMHRRGQSRDTIAAALGLPQTEVELLLKVHQIVLERVGE